MSHPAPSGTMNATPDGLSRRDRISCFSGVGLVGTLLPGVLWARLQEATGHHLKRPPLFAV
jgi:hypothetical protein